MDSEKRMAGEYEIPQAVSVGDREVVLGENPRAKPGEQYLCATCKRDDLFEQYSEAIVSDEYVELLQLFGERVRDRAETLLEDLRIPGELGIDDRPVSSEGFDPVSWEDSILGEVVLIKPEVLKPEYRRATVQYQLVTGGFGASAGGRGSACYCKNLYNGEESRFERQDILGIVRPEQMPQWVQDSLNRAERNHNHDKGAR